MTDEPLLCRATLGRLVPTNGAAEDALKLVNGQTVRIEIKKTRGNAARLGWYWVMLGIACDNLADRFDGPVNKSILHKWLKQRFGLSKPVRSKLTGDIIGWDEGSIAFHNLTETERAPYIESAVEFLAKQMGVHPADLKREAQSS